MTLVPGRELLRACVLKSFEVFIMFALVLEDKIVAVETGEFAARRWAN